jgi:DNA-binding IclR family transcriptional regulator
MEARAFKRRAAQNRVDQFQQLACFEAVKRKGMASAEEVARWCDLPLSDALRHLDALTQKGRLANGAGRWRVRS